MEEYYYDVPLTNARVLCVGPVTRAEADAAGVPFCNGVGSYLYLANADAPEAEIEILAKLVSEEAAELLRAALLGRFIPPRIPKPTAHQNL